MAYPLYTSAVKGLLESLVLHADFLCVTPDASQYRKLYRGWKATDGRGVATDQAACMSRADLCCIWGNTLTPRLLFRQPDSSRRLSWPRVTTLQAPTIWSTDSQPTDRFPQ